jgi:hypothetical protein
LRSDLYRSLYVEVDAVEGTEFSNADLDRFRAFLGEWCDKPDGIQVARSSVIPRSSARGHSADWIARRYIEGPPDDKGAAQPAYLYVLVYDNRINRNPLQSPRATELGPVKAPIPERLGRPENPHVNVFPYSAMIHVDRSWLGGLLPKRYWSDVLLHESGHVMGLVSRDSRAGPGGAHCDSKWCVMGRMSDNIQSDIARWLTRRKPTPDFCDACAAELRESRRSGQTAAQTRFAGPVMVREAARYRVISLPGAYGLFIGGSSVDQIGAFRMESRSSRDHAGTWWTAQADMAMGRDSILEAIAEARKDLDPNIRWAAEKLEKNIRGE